MNQVSALKRNGQVTYFTSFLLKELRCSVGLDPYRNLIDHLMKVEDVLSSYAVSYLSEMRTSSQ